MWGWPVTQRMGEQATPLNRTPHTGVDFGGPLGAPVDALLDGTVRRVFSDTVGGNQIEVQDEKTGVRALFAHLGAVLVRPGQRVTPTTDIGYVGASGKVTGPHLHLETRDSAGKLVDPLTVLGPTSTARAPDAGNTCGLDTASVILVGDRLRRGESPATIAADMTARLGRPITVECLQNAAYREADILPDASKVPVLGGIGQGAHNILTADPSQLMVTAAIIGVAVLLGYTGLRRLVR